MVLSKEDLLKVTFGVEEFDVPGIGPVKVRALTRSEALQVKGKELPVAEVEQKLLAWAMVEPALSEEDVKAWQDVVPAGLLEPLVDKIAVMSGMKKEAPKAAYADFRGESGS